MKRVFIFSTVIFLLAGALFLSYNFIFKNNDEIISSENNTKNIREKEKKKKAINPMETIGKIEQIIDTEIAFPSVGDNKKNIRYYNIQEKSFWEASFDGSYKKKIINEEFSDLKDIIWSPDKKQMIVKNGNNFYSYEYGKELKKIKDNIVFLDWSNLGNKIIYIYIDPVTKNKTLNIANLDGSEWKKIAKLNKDKIIISTVPQSSLISFWNNPNAFKETTMKTVSLTGGDIVELVKNKFGANYLWSPDGEKFLVSSVLKKGGHNIILELGGIENADKNKLMDLKFPTLISKCVWSKSDTKIIYCALPSGIPNDAIIPNDYQNKKFFTKDSFWKINIKNGKKERLVGLEDITEKIDATNLILSPSEDMLFFINRINNNLYRIVL
ncbi:MAG TPA: hypothetical protein ENJ27_02155 [Candidatus Moranbacteria bacterium]|nr:hypothetical protein [Candidatus Moranbacteria bacterium]